MKIIDNYYRVLWRSEGFRLIGAYAAEGVFESPDDAMEAAGRFMHRIETTRSVGMWWWRRVPDWAIVKIVDKQGHIVRQYAMVRNGLWVES